MIYGPAVGNKFSLIMEARRGELEASIPVLHPTAISDQLMAFRDEIRAGSMDEFNQWYALYSSVYTRPKQRRRTIMEVLQTHDE